MFSGDQNETLARVILCSSDDTNYIVLQGLKHPAIKFNYVSLANLFKNKAAVSLLFIFFKALLRLKDVHTRIVNPRKYCEVDK